MAKRTTLWTVLGLAASVLLVVACTATVRDYGGTGAGGASASSSGSGGASTSSSSATSSSSGTSGTTTTTSSGTSGTTTTTTSSSGTSSSSSSSTTSSSSSGGCPSPQVLCGSSCVLTGSDTSNCGGCGKTCATNDTCVNGACLCAAPNLLCGGACIDPSSDLHNCGACGHDCQIGTCSGSTCNPVLINAPTNVGVIAVDATYLYALDWPNGKLYTCPLAQCGTGGTMTLVYSGMKDPLSILPVPSVGSVFIGESSGSVVDDVTPAGTVNYLISGGASSGPSGLATDGNNLYFATNNSSIGILRTPLGANTPTKVGSAIAETLLYDPTTNALFAVNNGPFYKIALATDTVSNFYSESFQVNGAALTGGKLFYTIDDYPTGTNGGLFWCSTAAATCAPTPIVSGPAWGDEWRITADAAYLYFTSQSSANSGLYRCAVGGCGGAPTLLYDDEVAQSLVNDATSIYWTDGGQYVYRLAKQP